MTAEIICVGTELLLGDILNTNAQFLSRELAELGIIAASAAKISSSVGFVLGCGGVKIVQQSSYGSMDVSNVPILREILMISILSMPMQGRSTGRSCAWSVQASAAMVWLAT